MTDSEFKRQTITTPSNWKGHSNGKSICNWGYKPDRSFKDENEKVVCVMESCSTGDRKVSIGELCQADKFFHESAIKGVLVFSLCGSGASRPTPKSQRVYLRPYFLHLSAAGREFGVKTVFIIDESDFAEAQWHFRSDKFNDAAYVLEA